MPEPWTPARGLGMKLAATPGLARELLDHVAHGHHGVGHGQRVGVAQVDLVLAGASSCWACSTPMPISSSISTVRRRSWLARSSAQQVEVAAAVERGAARAVGVEVVEVEVLDLGRDEEGVALGAGAARGRGAAAGAGSPRTGVPSMLMMSQKTRATPSPSSYQGSSWKVVEVGPGQDVGLLDAAEAVDRAAVEGHPLVQGVLELGGGDVEGLVAPEDVGEPQLDEADAALLDGAQDVLGLALHTGVILAPPRPAPTGPSATTAAWRRGRRCAPAAPSWPAPSWPRPSCAATFFAAPSSAPRRAAASRPSRPSGAPRRRGPCWRWGGGPRASPRFSRATCAGDAHRRAAVGRRRRRTCRSGAVSCAPVRRSSMPDAVVGDVLGTRVAERLAARDDRVPAARRRASAWSRSWCGRPRRSSRPGSASARARRTTSKSSAMRLEQPARDPELVADLDRRRARRPGTPTGPSSPRRWCPRCAMPARRCRPACAPRRSRARASWSPPTPQ